MRREDNSTRELMSLSNHAFIFNAKIFYTRLDVTTTTPCLVCRARMSLETQSAVHTENSHNKSRCIGRIELTFFVQVCLRSVSLVAHEIGLITSLCILPIHTSLQCMHA